MNKNKKKYPHLQNEEERLRKICMNRLTELYGELPDSAIVVRLDKDVDACKPIKRILLDEQVKVQSLGEELPPSPVGRSLEWYANLVANCEAANAHRGSLQ